MKGSELIAKERQRQMDVEGWDAEHDKQHDEGELALVAALYATPVPLFAKKESCDGGVSFYDPWPWWDTVERPDIQMVLLTKQRLGISARNTRNYEGLLLLVL